MEIERQVVLAYLLRDDIANGRNDGDGCDIDTVISVLRTRVVDIRTALGDVVAVMPFVRRLTLADSDLFRELIGVMNIERQTVDTVTLVLTVEDIFILTSCIELMLSDRVTRRIEMLPYIRRIDVCDMRIVFRYMLRINVKSQYTYTVATMAGREGIVIQTRVVEEARRVALGQTPTQGVAFADRHRDGVVGLFPYVDMNVVNAVIAVNGLLAVLVVAGSGDVIQTAPAERYIVRTDIDRVICDMVGRVNIEREAVDTVASVDVRQRTAVFACDIQRIGVASQLSVLHPGMSP